MQTRKKNKLFSIMMTLLFPHFYLLNSCSEIYQCAVFFTCIVIIVNVNIAIHGRTKTLIGSAFALFVGFMMMRSLPYYIDGKIMNGLVFASFVSVIISLYWSTLIFKKMLNRIGLVRANFISLFLAAIIDGFVMGIFFVINNNFIYTRIAEIFAKEVSFKVMYGVIASMLMAVILNGFRRIENLKTMD